MASNWQSSIIPHSERIPCTNDNVFLPVNGTWKILVDKSSMIPKLNSVRVGSKKFTDSVAFKNFVNSFYGSLLFDVRDYNQIEFSGLGNIQDSSVASKFCGSSCACGNDMTKTLSLTCDLVGECATQLPCADPVRLVGHCCPICASVVTLRHERAKNRIVDQLLYLLVRSHLTRMDSWVVDHGYRGVQLYAHWLANGTMQIVIGNLDSTNPISHLYIKQLALNFDQDGKLSAPEAFYSYICFLKVRFMSIVVRMDYSSDWIQDTSLVGNLLLTLTILVVITLLVSAIYVYYHRNRYKATRVHSD